MFTWSTLCSASLSMFTAGPAASSGALHQQTERRLEGAGEASLLGVAGLCELRQQRGVLGAALSHHHRQAHRAVHACHGALPLATTARR